MNATNKRSLCETVKTVGSLVNASGSTFRADTIDTHAIAAVVMHVAISSPACASMYDPQSYQSTTPIASLQQPLTARPQACLLPACSQLVSMPQHYTHIHASTRLHIDKPTCCRARYLNPSGTMKHVAPICILMICAASCCK